MAGDGSLMTAEPETLPFPDPQSPYFHVFPHLPAELRLKVWHHSFEPRIVELHARRSHYADDYQHGGTPKWQSGCKNPAALSVNAEARAAAQEHYTVKFPLATVAASERPGDSVIDLYRVLYISPAVDTVVMLGDMDFRRVSSLLTELRRRDPEGDGLKRLAISASSTYHQGGGATLRVFARTMFRDLDELIIFMFSERVPPPDWNGGVCSLNDCSGTDYYRRYAMGVGKELKDGDNWMLVGRKRLTVMDLSFKHGW